MGATIVPIVLAVGGIVARASILTVVSRESVKFPSWVDYPFKQLPGVHLHYLLFLALIPVGLK